MVRTATKVASTASTSGAISRPGRAIDGSPETVMPLVAARCTMATAPNRSGAAAMGRFQPCMSRPIMKAAVASSTLTGVDLSRLRELHIRTPWVWKAFSPAAMAAVTPIPNNPPASAGLHALRPPAAAQKLAVMPARAVMKAKVVRTGS